MLVAVGCCGTCADVAAGGTTTLGRDVARTLVLVTCGKATSVREGAFVLEVATVRGRAVGLVAGAFEDEPPEVVLEAGA